MGTNTDIMQDLIRKDIQRTYPSADGWAVTLKAQGKTWKDFSATRIINGRRERVRIITDLEKKPSAAVLELLKSAGPGVVLVIPLEAEAPVAPGVTVQRMRSFAYREKELIWLKNSRRQTKAPAQPAAAA
jgi:hypothetical protein